MAFGDKSADLISEIGSSKARTFMTHAPSAPSCTEGITNAFNKELLPLPDRPDK